MTEKMFWMSFDLGIKGDYEGLYGWLDKYNARDCTSQMAAVVYEYENDFLDELKADLDTSLEIDKKTRIYVAYLDTDAKKLRGRFLFGSRKSPKWTGYYEAPDSQEIDF